MILSFSIVKDVRCVRMCTFSKLKSCSVEALNRTLVTSQGASSLMILSQFEVYRTVWNEVAK